MRQQALAHCRRQRGQRIAGRAGEGHIHRHHHLPLPTHRARIALVAARTVGTHQVLAASEHQQPRPRRRVDRHHRADRDPERISAFDHAVVAVKQQQVGTTVRVAVRPEDAGHFLLEVEAQAQHAHHRAGLGVQHALGIDQRLPLGRAQVAGTEGFHIAVAGQRLRQQRVAAALQRRGLVDLHQHVAGGIEQDDLVVHRVLVAVGAQALADGLFVVRQAGDEGAQLVVGGEKAHVRGALVQVAHHDVDHVLRLGADLAQHGGHLLAHQAGHQLLLQPVEAIARGGHGRQDGARFLGAVHLGGRLDDAPHQVEFLQRLLATDDVAHIGQKGIDLERFGVFHAKGSNGAARRQRTKEVPARGVRSKKNGGVQGQRSDKAATTAVTSATEAGRSARSVYWSRVHRYPLTSLL